MIKTAITYILIAIISAGASYGQSENATLLLQSTDGSKVKLAWQFRHPDKSITTFDIKRKTGVHDWVKLNSEPIVPEISVKKKLSVVESDKTESGRVMARLLRMLAAKKITEISHEDFLQKLGSNDKELKYDFALMAQVYDIALMAGFGYVDNSAKKKEKYQYGLFDAVSGQMLATAGWEYGEVPDLNVISNITSKATTGKNGIELIWNVDIPKAKAASVAGYNIYREGIRLNLQPVVAAASADNTEYRWADSLAGTKAPAQYSISAVSLFGIEGTIKSYVYDPADHPKDYTAALPTEIAAIGYYAQDGIRATWAFPKDQEKYIKGFYIEKDNIPDGYKKVSDLLDPQARTFIDKGNSPVSSYVRFKIDAVYKDKTFVTGKERLYSYFPLSAPVQPQNLQAKAMMEDGRFIVNLTWDEKILGDNFTDYFQLYVSDPLDERFDDITVSPPILTNHYSYEIKNSQAAVYRFYITAVGASKIESLPSDTASVRAPSMVLPAVTNIVVTPDNGNIRLRWQYPNIEDQKGFKIYANGLPIASETEVNKDRREYVVMNIGPSEQYTFSITAISETGVASPQATAAPVTAPAAEKGKKEKKR